MSRPFHTPDDDPIDADAARKDAARQRYVAMLEQLAEAGLELALAIKTRAIEADAPDEAAMSFSRVSRAVRMTVLLLSHLIDGPAGEAAKPEAMQYAYSWDYREERRFKRVQEVVEQAAKAETAEAPERAMRLIHEAVERLNDDDIYAEIMRRPIAELIAQIRRDLDLSGPAGSGGLSSGVQRAKVDLSSEARRAKEDSVLCGLSPRPDAASP